MKEADSSSEEKRTIESTLKSNLPSPLDLTVKLRLYEELSNESKWLVHIILETPAEFKGMITDKNNKVTKHSVRKFIQSVWPHFTIHYVLRELKKWVSTF